MPADGAAPSDLVRLYLERRQALVRFFTARTGSASEAEDLVQELYIKVRDADPAGVVNGPAFLFRLGLNLMTDRYRARQRSLRRDGDYQNATQSALGGHEIDDSPSPEDRVAGRKRLEKLLTAVEALPPQTRRVFRMHKIEGMSHGEVAAALGVSRSAVEKHMIAALRHLAGAKE